LRHFGTPPVSGKLIVKHFRAFKYVKSIMENTHNETPNTEPVNEEVKAGETTAEETTAEEVVAEEVAADQGTPQAETHHEGLAEHVPAPAPIEKLQDQLNEAKDKYLRLYADFENYRRRVAKEKLEFFTTANEDLIKNLLPVLDDFERAQKTFTSESEEVIPLKQGVELVYNKLARVLEQKGAKPMKSIGETFNPDLHEAVTQFPAPTAEQKGKVIDEIEKGYFLGEKVIRYAKVVVGA
jgi:molecular chaperone GrpE